ncbi:MAG: alpha-galactosidase [Clostridia bacterium]|nr:alpha-galactosidase [Clostridia bacterium]
MILHFDRDETLTFEVLPPLYLPFYNKWSANAYTTYEPFDLDPFNHRAVSTSGSPVVLAGEKFFGFLNERGGRFTYDGSYTLSIFCPAGQALYVDEHCNPYDAWRAYSETVLADETLNKPVPAQPFWSGLEFCTWVDQKNKAVRAGSRDMWSQLNEQYVYDYMKRVEKLGLPKGKLTIDDGWDIRYAPDGRMCYGNWQINREKFPHMEQLVKDMTEEGFIPGLWFAPFTFTPNCELAKKYPHLIGDTFSENAEGEAVRQLMFIHPDPVLEAYYTDIFTTYIGMGFRKFKLDMSYGTKREMKELLAMMYRVIKSINPAVEVEAHIPDIFVSRYCDTVRINDVSLEHPWRAVTTEHYRVCRNSSPDRILNLDHLGTNTPDPDENGFMAHSKMLLKLDGGYPCVSLLPDIFSQKSADTYVGLVREWVDKHSK